MNVNGGIFYGSIEHFGFLTTKFFYQNFAVKKFKISYIIEYFIKKYSKTNELLSSAIYFSIGVRVVSFIKQVKVHLLNPFSRVVEVGAYIVSSLTLR